MSNHFLISILISSIVLICLFRFKRSLVKKIGFMWWIHLLGAFAIYGLIVYLAWWTGEMHQIHLNNFDLNKDGSFNGSEITPEMKQAMQKVTRDTGRNFAFIVGIPISIILTFIIFLFDSFLIYIWNKLVKK